MRADMTETPCVVCHFTVKEEELIESQNRSEESESLEEYQYSSFRLKNVTVGEVIFGDKIVLSLSCLLV